MLRISPYRRPVATASRYSSARLGPDIFRQGGPVRAASTSRISSSSPMVRRSWRRSSFALNPDSPVSGSEASRPDFHAHFANDRTAVL
ncbi:hypothetical protein [Planctomyces sp. SH-PL62]|uniref:hypothetical protein n=1 Tax=Planctomyces sp. SH-PL62 TaxID=1636152 RepID=UPI000839413A|nr:hypothetical protein [Planctomyces sp. SH-PL62]